MPTDLKTINIQTEKIHKTESTHISSGEFHNSIKEEI
jgi:hypothetical protein